MTDVAVAANDAEVDATTTEAEADAEMEAEKEEEEEEGEEAEVDGAVRAANVEASGVTKAPANGAEGSCANTGGLVRIKRSNSACNCNAERAMYESRRL